MDQMLGTIQLFPYRRIPAGWMECDGRELPVKTNQPLTALIGNRFGGDGHNVIRLPDLRGRVVAGAGTAMPFATPVGTERHTLAPQEIPAHTHVLMGSTSLGNSADPAGGVPATGDVAVLPYAPPDAQLTAMAQEATPALVGANPHENRQPYTVLVWAICVDGIFPSRARG